MVHTGGAWVSAAAARLQAAAKSDPVIAAPPGRWAVGGSTPGDRPGFSGAARGFTMRITHLTNWGNAQVPVHAPAFAKGQR